MGGQWRSPSVRLDREWPRAQGAFVPHPCWQQLLPGTALISLPSPHLSFAEELQAQRRARGDAKKGECVQSAAPVLCALCTGKPWLGVGAGGGFVCLDEGFPCSSASLSMGWDIKQRFLPFYFIVSESLKKENGECGKLPGG